MELRLAHIQRNHPPRTRLQQTIAEASGGSSNVQAVETRHIHCQGLAGIPGLEKMVANPKYGLSSCDPPIQITPFTAQNAYALVAA